MKKRSSHVATPETEVPQPTPSVEVVATDEKIATTKQSATVPAEKPIQEEQTATTGAQQPESEQQVSGEEPSTTTLAEQSDESESSETTATDASDKETFGTRCKDFFVALGRRIRTSFVDFGKNFCKFWVNFWHRTVKFFKNVGVFFRMLWSLCVEAKLKMDDRRAKRRAKKAALEAGESGVTEQTVAKAEQTELVADTSTQEALPAPDNQSSETLFETDEQEEEVDEVKLMRSRFAHFFRRRTKDEWKTALLGNNEKKGAISLIVSYALLILFGFVYIYPMLYMLAYSLMGESDVVNPLVTYWPTEWQWSNYSEAAQTLDFFHTLWNTIYISVLPSLFQTVACGLTAYGLARFNFPGKKVIFGLIILTFVIPPQLTMMPQLIIFTKLSFSGNVLSFMVPAALGQGIKSAVFILIFYQFFRGIPDSIVEAAKIDGANAFQIFSRIGIPAAKPAILLSFLLSVVWYYNETVLTTVYMGTSVATLPISLENFRSAYEALFPSATTGKSVNEAIYMAGTLLNVLPLIIMYFFTQRYFVDGIDKAGITGE